MRKIIVLILILLALVVLGFYFYHDILDFYFRLSEKISQVEKISEPLVKEIKKEISTPPPLRATQETPEAFLTKAGIIKWTNDERQSNGLPPLKGNAKLNAAALSKAQDMFKNQYFAHLSPSGAGPSELAKNAGYEFIAIGENLAMGNFANDQVLVQAWMDSPGHRANILNSRFSEIGVAAVKGVFEGQTTWLAVQEFGLPLAACPQPNLAIEKRIETYQNQLNQLAQTIETKKAQIKNTRFTNRSQFIQAVNEYNNLVEQYNGLIIQTRTLVEQYNREINQFNECVNQISS